MRQIGNKLFPDKGKHLKNKKTGRVCPFGGILLRHGEKMEDYTEVKAKGASK